MNWHRACSLVSQGQEFNSSRQKLMTDINHVAEQILRYLEANPKASDTLEGVAQWWLMRQRLTESIVLVQGALKILEDKGLIVERRNVDGGLLYMVAQRG